MGANRKAYLAGKLVEFLNQTGAIQQELADFAGIGQGLVADHIRQKSFPKIAVLLKYRDFFTRKLARAVTLYELTNDSIFKGIEKEANAIGDLTAEERAVVDAYNALPDDDWRKKAIEEILLKTKEVEKKKNSKDKAE